MNVFRSSILHTIARHRVEQDNRAERAGMIPNQAAQFQRSDALAGLVSRVRTSYANDGLPDENALVALVTEAVAWLEWVDEFRNTDVTAGSDTEVQSEAPLG